MVILPLWTSFGSSVGVGSGRLNLYLNKSVKLLQKIRYLNFLCQHSTTRLAPSKGGKSPKFGTFVVEVIIYNRFNGLVKP